jgi:6-pyruvoyltetrahydropterin/6-carboxytetrahydropterin synthase
MIVSKSFTFDAAHRLQHHDGKCRNLHGHTYRVDIAVQADSLFAMGPKEGMVLDFSDLTAWWRRIEPVLDHVTILQETDPIAAALVPSRTTVTTFPWPPTAERLAAWILADLMEDFDLVEHNATVRVYETATSWAQAGRLL